LDDAVSKDEFPHVCTHHEREVGVACRLCGDELQELVLAHEGDVREPRPQAAEVGDRDRAFFGGDRKLRHLLMRQLEDSLGEAQVVEDLHRRGVKCVAAKLTVEVVVSL
jgi:hypothetical protein